jgi:hypothetical protein
MKTTKVTFLFIAFSVVCLINSSSQALNSNVDSVYNAIKGTWYKVYTYSGMTGDRDTIYNSDSTVIKRIPETDSISWKEYKNGLLINDFKYMISYSNSLIYQSGKWMLKGGDIGLLISIENFGFTCFIDAFDGGGVGYSPSTNSNVDFVCNALKGTWYRVYTYSGKSGDRDNVYDSDSTVIKRIPGTDSISWKEYKNGLLINEFKYLISYSNSNIYQSSKWMLKGGNIGLLISLENFGFSYFLDAYDGGGVGYSQSKIPNGLFESNGSKEKFIVIHNQINKTISISGNAQVRRVAIYDLNGKIQSSLTNVESGQLIDISDLQTGIYLVAIDTYNERLISRIIKK